MDYSTAKSGTSLADGELEHLLELIKGLDSNRCGCLTAAYCEVDSTPPITAHCHPYAMPYVCLDYGPSD